MVDQDYYRPARPRLAVDPNSDEASARAADDREFLLTQRDSNTLISFGGYAALRFALAIEPDACVVFAPQTRPITDDHRPSVNYSDAAVSRPHPALLDLASLYRTRSARFPVAIHLCESEASTPPEAYFWDDWAHVEGMQQALGVEIWRQPCSVHPVAEYLTRTDQRADVVDRFISFGQGRDG